MVKKVKPDFKKLGPKYGKLMKYISAAIGKMSQEDIDELEKTGSYEIDAGKQKISIGLDDVEILSEDIPGWLVSSEGRITVALDVTITRDLRYEGIAREFINRIQNIRKDSGFDVTDKIVIEIEKNENINEAVMKHRDYIGSQTLANEIRLVDRLNSDANEIEIVEDITTKMKIVKV